MFGQMCLDACRMRNALLDSAQILAGDSRLNGAVHPPPSPLVGGVVERADGIFHDRRQARGRCRAARRVQRLLDAHALRVIEQIRVKTDGVPLFVEELTKSVVESVESVGSAESPNRPLLQLAIPATLQEALLARLDRLSRYPNSRQSG